jgi:putative transposase
MARKPRRDLAGLPQHVVQRGNDRQACFRDDDDRLEYLFRLRTCASRASVAVHAYVFMSNHVHLLATAGGPGGIARLMQGIGAAYVPLFNARHGRTGTLWEGRYRTCAVDTDAYLWHCHRYIELNPVRAGLVGAPGEFPWSSFGHNANGRTDPLITPHPNYLALGRNPAARAAAYRIFFDAPLSVEAIACLRKSTRMETPCGDAAFLERIAQQRRAPDAPGGVASGDQEAIRPDCSDPALTPL